MIFARGVSNNFPQLYASDFDNTINYTQTNSQNRQESAYVTRIYRNNKYIATIIGYKTKNDQYLNIVSVPYEISENRKGVTLFYIDGTKIGNYEIENNIVVDTGIMSDNENSSNSNNAQVARSWWSCSRHCISDAHIACYGDPECTTMLLISNLPNGNGLSGLGSGSFAFSCGVACAFNTNLDLLHHH